MMTDRQPIPDQFLKEVPGRYHEINAAALNWMLGRKPLHGCFLNTKVNSLTLEDYAPGDGLRGPDYLYGWIQGRGLEALVTHSRIFANVHPTLAMRLDAAARKLYRGLCDLISRDGHAYFCYGPDLTPIFQDADGRIQEQQQAGRLYTYSDAFTAKGVVAAASHFNLPELDDHLLYLKEVIASIEDRRFQMNERVPISQEALDREEDDFGPRMILLGAAGMLRRYGLARHAQFAEPFIADVVGRYLDPTTGLLRTVPGKDESNIGHAIEFAGFALDFLPADADPYLVNVLERVVLESFRHGSTGTGIVLTTAISTVQPTSPYCPWWSLPETIRSAALAFERTRNPAILDVWKAADRAFFNHYWRVDPPIAYQCRTARGPVDQVPATPDLDPGYHTGLSLLTAGEAAQRIGRNA